MIHGVIREFDGDQWACMAHEHGLDRQPFPLQIAQTPQTEDAAHLLWSTIRTALPAADNPWHRAVFRTLAKAEHQVAIYGGLSVPAKAPPSAAQLRVHASIAGADAVAITQAPGPSAVAGGALHVWYGQRGGVAEQLAAAVPPYPRGRTAELSALCGLVSGKDQPVTIFESATPPPAERIRQLLRMPRVAEGWIEIDTNLGQPHHRRSRTGWVDVDGDGRYLLRWPFRDITISSAGTAELAAFLQGELPAPVPAAADW